ncbi:histidine phosphatase family protein [Streptomyces albicerus]|uniref:histidine phosphatase family protein n=1 Tax=Streptomyces albicerus TaxID=2569859 RepID=UPI00124B2195|nr:histidine phosphatase family protein [Streptomyces albicerus]
MTCRVMLISPAISAALREARFDDECPLDAAGLRLARSAAGSLPAPDQALASPTVRCRETATALGLDAVAEPELAGLDVGRWRGATLAEVSAGEPEAVGRWLADPASAPHGGESVRALCERVAKWLEAAAGSGTGRIVAVVEPEIVRAGVVRALGAPESAFWRVDVPPLTATEFSGRAGRWNVRVGRALGE